MSETKNVVIQQNNGNDYNVLYPKGITDEKLFSYWWKIGTPIEYSYNALY